MKNVTIQRSTGLKFCWWQNALIFNKITLTLLDLVTQIYYYFSFAKSYSVTLKSPVDHNQSITILILYIQFYGVDK